MDKPAYRDVRLHLNKTILIMQVTPSRPKSSPWTERQLDRPTNIATNGFNSTKGYRINRLRRLKLMVFCFDGSEI